MKNHLKNIKAFIDSIETLSEEEKSMLIKSIKKADEELMILDFKFKRSEKIRKTTTTFLDASVEELENKNKELEATLQKLNTTQAQLIQSEKMASLGELTSGIAHEIQNPLNFVNNFSDVSSEMIDEAIEELDNNEVNEVKDILSDLKGNLEKISHHGNRASSIVKGMLDHSLESSAEKVPTDINALCDEYIR
jgi:C4-dicarboxylate-specific signal transduction histidine kinase